MASGAANDRQVSFSSSMIFLSFFASILMLTPIRAKGLSARFLTSDRSWGQLARHVGQYCDQK
jgi:hypothetical protein